MPTAKRSSWYGRPFRWPTHTVEEFRGQREGHLPDDGCCFEGVRVSDTCLACPLVRCKYDDVLGARAYVRAKEGRHPPVSRVWVKEYAEAHGISEITVWRRLKAGKEMT